MISKRPNNLYLSLMRPIFTCNVAYEIQRPTSRLSDRHNDVYSHISSPAKSFRVTQRVVSSWSVDVLRKENVLPGSSISEL